MAEGADAPGGSWLPLESNPEVLNPFCKRLGLEDGWGFCDVFGLDPELLCMVPQPCAALCLLFPSEKISRPRREDLRSRRAKMDSPEPGLFFLQQHDGIGNACGTIAAVHAISNGAVSGMFSLKDGSPLSQFLAKAAPLSAPERGTVLANSKDLQEMSDTTAAAGETEGAGTDDANDSHFITFLPFKGKLYELDGRTFGEDGVAFPVVHCDTTPDTWVMDAARLPHAPSTSQYNRARLHLEVVLPFTCRVFFAIRCM
ncbi:unnamed protein product [Prorocentrum cordatum]|uniref:Ubiquitin carboxyl-terminal hydrolase n=1 Tax=Prorocentrum cordatum TaxID=2364126 RepID=A0ABN9V417_9DINO|nr:unnamed protein product [Polarella glacialis]